MMPARTCQSRRLRPPAALTRNLQLSVRCQRHPDAENQLRRRLYRTKSLQVGAIAGLSLFTGSVYGTVFAKVTSAAVGAAATNIVLQDSNSKMNWKSFGIDVACSAITEGVFNALEFYNPALDISNQNRQL